MRLNRTISVGIIAAALAAGCAKSELRAPESSQETTGIKVVFTSDFSEADGTRTVLADGSGSRKSVEWVQGDEIKIWCFNAEGTLTGVTATADNAGASTTFSATVPEADTYYAVHPADAAFKVSIDSETGAETVLVTLPSQDGSFEKANVCVAKTSLNESHFAFKNICPIVKLSVERSDITSFNLYDLARKGIRGTVNLQFGASGDVILGDIPQEDISSYRTTATPESPAAGTVYIAVLPGSYAQGLAVHMASDENFLPVYLNEKEQSLSRKEILNLGRLDDKVNPDLYVSTEGSGDGLSASDPMSFTRFCEEIGYETAESESEAQNADYMRKAFRVAGHTYHFAAGTYYFAKQVPMYFSGMSGDLGNNGVRFNVVGDEGAESTFFDGSKIAGSSTRMLFVNSYATPTFRGITFQNGETTESGGAIDITAKRNPRFFDCIFKNNKAAKAAGAVYVNGGVTTFENCVFEDNSATAGNGGAIKVNTATGNLTLRKCTFKGNKAEGSYGGAVVVEETSGAAAVLVCVGCTFEGNSSKTNSGAIRVNGGQLTMDGCTFKGNEATGTGSSTYAGTGGAIYIGVDGSRAAITNSTFEGNRAVTSGAGGAINFQAKKTFTTISGCTFKENSSKGTGGAFTVAGAGPDVSVTGCKFEKNSADTYGGVCYIANGISRFHDCIFTDNTAGTRCGGVYGGTASVFVNACTFDGNAMSKSVNLPNALYSSSAEYGFMGVTNSTIHTPASALGTYDVFAVSSVVLAYNTFVSECTKSGHIGVYSTAPANGRVVLTGNIISEPSAGTAVKAADADTLCSAGFNFYSSGEFTVKSEYDSEAVPELVLKSSESGQKYYSWDGTTPFTKGTQAALSEALDSLKLGKSVAEGTIAKYKEWLESVEAFTKDQIGGNRSEEALTPGSVQL